MSFTCPDCLASGSLRITSRLELPPDNRSNEIALQVIDCSGCTFAGIAVYEESRRGALDRESFAHTGYRVSPDELERVRDAIGRCPQPDNWHCLCQAHRTFGTKNASGRWNGLSGMRLEGAFGLQPHAA